MLNRLPRSFNRFLKHARKNGFNPKWELWFAWYPVRTPWGLYWGRKVWRRRWTGFFEEGWEFNRSADRHLVGRPLFIFKYYGYFGPEDGDEDCFYRVIDRKWRLNHIEDGTNNG